MTSAHQRFGFVDSHRRADSSLGTDSISNSIRGHRSFCNNVLKVARRRRALEGSVMMIQALKLFFVIVAILLWYSGLATAQPLFSPDAGSARRVPGSLARRDARNATRSLVLGAHWVRTSRAYRDPDHFMILPQRCGTIFLR